MCIDTVILFSVVILSGATDPDFQGFLVQGRVMAGDTAIGTFTDNGDDQKLVCDGDVSVIRSQYCYHQVHIYVYGRNQYGTVQAQVYTRTQVKCRALTWQGVRVFRVLNKAFTREAHTCCNLSPFACISCKFIILSKLVHYSSAILVARH